MLEIIGSGLGRTGTFTAKLALEQLGFAPCHHMVEVLMHPESIALWVAAAGGGTDWDALFAGYRSMVDHPGCQYWRELANWWPDAKVLHTVRDPDDWFDSTQATIFGPTLAAADPPLPMRALLASVHGWYGGDVHDRPFMTEFFRRHTQAVKAAIPTDRLLVWNVADGWEPLCGFLKVAVPPNPMPRENTREQFQARAAKPLTRENIAAEVRAASQPR